MKTKARVYGVTAQPENQGSKPQEKDWGRLLPLVVKRASNEKTDRARGWSSEGTEVPLAPRRRHRTIRHPSEESVSRENQRDKHQLPQTRRERSQQGGDVTTASAFVSATVSGKARLCRQSSEGGLAGQGSWGRLPARLWVWGGLRSTVIASRAHSQCPHPLLSLRP